MLDARREQARIAVVDDDPVFLELMLDLLSVGEGHDVRTSGDWIGSIEFITRVQPDLVILDLMMGCGEAGWAVIDVLRSDPGTHRIPIILCSAAVPAMDNQARRMRDLGAVELIAKPFDFDDLLGAIQRLLRQTSATLLAAK